MSDAAPQPEKKKSGSSVLIIVLLVILVGGGIVVCVCCGGMGWLGVQGVNAAADAVKASVEGDPVIQEKLGGVDSVSMNIQATATYQQENNEQNVVLFDIVGPSGSGKLILNNDDQSLTLQTGGEKIPLEARLDSSKMGQP